MREVIGAGRTSKMLPQSLLTEVSWRVFIGGALPALCFFRFVVPAALVQALQRPALSWRHRLLVSLSPQHVRRMKEADKEQATQPSRLARYGRGVLKGQEGFARQSRNCVAYESCSV